MKYLGFSKNVLTWFNYLALNVIDKVNLFLKFLHRQNHFLTLPLGRLMQCTEPLFDHACTAWFSNISKRLKLCLQASQNKCIRFCLQLDKRFKICVKGFYN